MNQKAAVIGAGYWGKNLVRNFYELRSLGTICDLNQALLANFRAKYSDIPTTTDVASILADQSFGAVAIATPAVTHYELVKKALLAGKDVLVEKPLALRVSEGEELLALAKTQQKVLMVDHLLHYHPAIEKLKELIAAGKLGEIQYVYSNRLNLGKIRREENVLWSFAPHDISIVLSIMGKLPHLVSVHGAHYLQKAVADTTVTSLTFDNSKKGHIFVSWLHPYKDQKLVVVGTKKMVVFDDVSEKKLVAYPHRVEIEANVPPLVHQAEAEVVSVETTEPLRRACSHFLQCVRGRTVPRTDGNEALGVLRVLQACQESLENGGAQVFL